MREGERVVMAMNEVWLRIRAIERRLLIIERFGRRGLPSQNADGHSCADWRCVVRLGQDEHRSDCIYRVLAEFDAETERIHGSCEDPEHVKIPQQ